MSSVLVYRLLFMFTDCSCPVKTWPETLRTLTYPRPVGGGGGGVCTPPLRFIEDSEMGGARRRVFTRLTPHVFATFVKNSTQGHARSGDQVRSSDATRAGKSCRSAVLIGDKLMSFGDKFLVGFP